MKKKILIIKEIHASDTFPVRHAVLRPGKPIESCHFDGDNSETTFHFGLYTNHQLVGILSLFKNKNPIFEETSQFQIRGMAILENHQKQGFGKLLIQYATSALTNRNEKFIWFNARESAVDFYKKLGFETIGTPFDIATVGIHFLFFKKL